MPASLQLLLIRHGVTDWNESGRLMGRLPLALNERGRAAAEALAQALASVAIDAIFASPRQRTQETAALIAAPHGLKVDTDPELDEVWLGRWEGKLFSDLSDDDDYRAYRLDPTHCCDAVERAIDIECRVLRVLERLRSTFTRGTIALVSHGDPLRILLAHELGLELRHYRRLVVEPASASLLEIGKRQSRLLALSWKPRAEDVFPPPPPR